MGHLLTLFCGDAAVAGPAEGLWPTQTADAWESQSTVWESWE
jgi:hypothetical protein